MALPFNFQPSTPDTYLYEFSAAAGFLSEYFDKLESATLKFVILLRRANSMIESHEDSLFESICGMSVSEMRYYEVQRRLDARGVK